MAEPRLPAATTRMAGLVECLCAEVGATVCFCGPFPGGDTPMDFCSECDGGMCGQAWVRLVAAYPSSVFPEPDLSGTCSMPLAYEWEVGIARCAPTMDDLGNPPTRDQLLEATARQYEDLAAMRKAIQCCFADGLTDYILGVYTPQQVLGACLSSTWQVFSR